MSIRWILAVTLLLAGCGTQPRATAVAPDAQLAHADGLMSGYAGKVGSHDGKASLLLVHQGLLIKPIAFDQVFVKLPIGEIGSAIYLGTDHNLYAGWSDPLKPAPDDYYAIGSYAGTPVVGQALKYQLAPNARLTFIKATTDILTGRQIPDATRLDLKPLPPSVGKDPDLVRG